YDILPFLKEATLRDLRKCMDDAINLLVTTMGQYEVPHVSDDELIEQFCKQLTAAQFLRVGAYAKGAKSLTPEQIKDADGYINFTQPCKYRVEVQTSCLRRWYTDDAARNRLVALLRDRGMMLAGRQADTCSRQ